MAEINSEELCRICLKESYLYSNVFTDELDDGSHFVDVVNDLLQLDMEFEDGFPQTICSECYNKISKFEMFKRIAHEGRAVLLYSKGNIGNDEIKLEDGIASVRGFVPVQNETDANSEDETDDFGTPVQTEMYLVPGEIESNESLPIGRDPLEADVKNEIEDPLHLDDDERPDLEVSSMPVNFAESEENRIQMTLLHEEEGRKFAYKENVYRNMGTADENGIQQEGGIKLTSVSLPNASPDSSSLNNNVTQDGCILGDGASVAMEDENEKDVHISGKRFKCKFCEKSCNDRSNMKKHELVHTNVKPHKCPFCSKHFKYHRQMKIHEKIHTGEKDLKCNFCEKRFRFGSYLKEHELVHTGEKTLQCKFCPKYFKYRSSLNSHEKMHTVKQDIKCKFCLKEFCSRQYLKVHERSHTGEKPYHCRYCPKRFSVLGGLKVHENKHKGETPYKCKFCQKMCNKLGDLKLHERVHTGEKPFRCKFCPKHFSRNSRLKSHEKIHTGEKPFKCYMCDKGFCSKDGVRQHLSYHTGEKRFKCVACDKVFRWKCNLRKHIAVHACENPF